MSKTNDTTKLTIREHRDTLADTELDAVTGGMLYLGAPIGYQCEVGTNKCTSSSRGSIPALRGHDY
jgi:hypothetical protein